MAQGALSRPWFEKYSSVETTGRPLSLPPETPPRPPETRPGENWHHPTFPNRSRPQKLGRLFGKSS